MAEWEPQPFVNTEMNGRLASSLWALDVWQVFKAELWEIGLALEMALERRETLQVHGVKTVAVFSD